MIAYIQSLTNKELLRTFNRIAERTRLDEYGDYATYAHCHPHSYRVLRALDGERKARLEQAA